MRVCRSAVAAASRPCARGRRSGVHRTAPAAAQTTTRTTHGTASSRSARPVYDEQSDVWLVSAHVCRRRRGHEQHVLAAGCRRRRVCVWSMRQSLRHTHRYVVVSFSYASVSHCQFDAIDLDIHISKRHGGVGGALDGNAGEYRAPSDSYQNLPINTSELTLEGHSTAEWESDNSYMSLPANAQMRQPDF